MHPSHQKAREISAQRQEREREHQRWRDQHYPEELIPTSSATLSSNLTMSSPRELRKDYDGELIYKTTWSPPSAPLDDTASAAWNEWAGSHCDLVREEMDELADEVGSITGKLERRLNQLSNEVKRLHKALKE